MTKSTGNLLFVMLLATAVLPFAQTDVCAAAPVRKGDVWEQREKLVRRFGFEWDTLCVMERELDGVDDILADLRDIELFPSSATGLDKAALARFDRQADRIGSACAGLRELTKASAPSLLDAMGILREMAVHEPVEAMFDLLERGDVKRSAEMKGLMRRVAALWQDIGGLLAPVAQNSFISRGTPATGDGQTGVAARYSILTDALLDSLANRAPAPAVKEMFSIEDHRIRQLIREKCLLRAQRKIAVVATRYRGKIDLTDLKLSAARTGLLCGDYVKALAAASELPDTGLLTTSRHLYRMQSLYGLRMYDSVWQEGERLDFSRIGGARRNMLLWLCMESGLALQKKDVFVRLASFVDRKAAYAMHVMHALGRSYLAAADSSTALSIFESAMKFPLRSGDDAGASRELRYAVAETNYELGRYETALHLFAELANDPSGFEHGLYGMLWCYLMIGKNDKAETVMQTLIDQTPDSRFAADAFLVLGQRFLYKAQYGWKKLQYLTKEKQRLQDLLAQLNDKRKIEGGSGHDSLFVRAAGDLDGMLSRIAGEPRDNYASLVDCYERADKIARLINAYYATGSFQQAVFTEKREMFLHVLDSLISAAKTPHRTESVSPDTLRQSGGDTAIGATVAQAMIFGTEVMVERRRFELEYLNWQKVRLNYNDQEALRRLSGKNDVASQKEIAGLKGSSARMMDSLLSAEEQTRRTWHRTLVDRLKTVLARGTDSANAAYLHYHLGELFYTEENALYAREYDAYDKMKTAYDRDMTAYREGRLAAPPREPSPPHTSHEQSLAEFTKVLSLDSSSAAAAAHYSIAWCWNDQALFDSALAHMQIVATRFPECPFAAQAWMYAGEYMFDKGDLARAIQCYQAVMKYPESEWFDEALYKLAWSQYRLSNPDKAISSFLALVDLGGGRKSARALLEKESMDYVAISFSESDMTGEKGLERATLFAKKLGDPDRGSQILQRLARVYMDQGRYDLAKKTYRTLLRINPYYRNTPLVESDLLAAIERDAMPEQANQYKIDFFMKYNSNGPWAKTQVEAEAVARADSLAEKQLYEGAIGYHQMALQKNDTAAYNRALDVYTDFIRAYPKSPRASECHYNLAEIEFSLGNYSKATEDYITVSMRYPDSKFRETAAWNAIVASQNLLKKETPNK